MKDPDRDIAYVVKNHKTALWMSDGTSGAHLDHEYQLKFTDPSKVL